MKRSEVIKSVTKCLRQIAKEWKVDAIQNQKPKTKQKYQTKTKTQKTQAKTSKQACKQTNKNKIKK